MLIAALALMSTSALLPAGTPVTISVDLSDAPQRIIHARMVIPASPGPLTLVYPKWIPGEHGPTGPIADVVDLKVTAGGKIIPWKRDSVDMYAIHCDVPQGANAIEVSLDFITPSEAKGFSAGTSATTELAVLNWNQVMLAPQGAPADGLTYKANLRVPREWRYATALPVEHESGDTVAFAPASMTTLIDSPVLTGRNFRTEDLSPGSSPRHYLHVAADSRAALEMSPETLAAYRNLIAETGALFGARHYRRYDFLLTLSDHVAHFGLEHHESSDNRTPELALVEDTVRKLNAGLLPHEMSHSWNGKYRRPDGLATPDYQKPYQDALLWVYEGLPTYLGDILTARSGLLNPDEYRQGLALDAARMDVSPGRRWRPLIDTAVAAPILYGTRPDRSSLRRGVDFYPEGALVWLDADVTIRTLSQGKKSLDDFCRAFFGGPSGPPEVKPYTLNDVLSALNAIQPYDWAMFFDERIKQVAPRAPLGGIEGGGWKLVYKEKLPPMMEWQEQESKGTNLVWSIGLSLREDGTVIDSLTGMPADRAGVAPGTQVIAVNGRQFNQRVIRTALREAKNSTEPIELLVKSGEYYKTHKIDYHEGEKYPWLERDDSRPDLLTNIISARKPS